MQSSFAKSPANFTKLEGYQAFTLEKKLLSELTDKFATRSDISKIELKDITKEYNLDS